MNNKEIRYKELVNKRRNFKFTDLLNTSEIICEYYDENQIGPWSSWQGNLDADILVIGQDWGDINHYLKNGENEGREEEENSTNKNLIELFKMINIDIGTPINPNKKAAVFFTNAILGIKDNGMSSKVKEQWEKECTENFLYPLIEIIKPKIILTLGTVPFKAIKRVYKLKQKPVLRELINQNPIILDSTKIFAFYHCGGLGLANRKLDIQKEDWIRINEYIK